MLVIPFAFIAGLIFGLGLLLSGLADPARMLNGFDFAAYAAGKWNPDLAIVTLVAILIAKAGFRLLAPTDKPLIADNFASAPRRRIDPPALIGAVLLGIGWGLAGYSPGSALACLLLGRVETGIFLLAMLGGIAFYQLLKSGSS